MRQPSTAALVLGCASYRNGLLEAIAEREWGADEVYLHAATKQPRLLQMYAKLGYEELPSFDQPGWVLAWSGREPTRYHVKRLGLREAIGSA